MNIHSASQLIQLNASAAFQLLVAAEDEAVREAAAEALWPRELIQPQDLECNDVPFESLSYADQARALLVASVVEANPSSATRLRVEPQYHFLASPPASDGSGPQRLFRMGCRANAPSVRRPWGMASRWKRAATFAVPANACETMMQVCSWGAREREPYRSQYQWTVDPLSVSINVSNRLALRAGTSCRRPVLVSVDGEELPFFNDSVVPLILTRKIELSSGLIVRLCAGSLNSSVISFGNQLPIVRGHRPRDATLSLEIGPSLDSPVIGSYFKGNFEPRYNLAPVVPKFRLGVQALGGRTVAELHGIAQRVGVWHGRHLRGSFTYHPLRSDAIAQPGALQGALQEVA